jgi:hypothetical protein
MFNLSANQFGSGKMTPGVGSQSMSQNSMRTPSKPIQPATMNPNQINPGLSRPGGLQDRGMTPTPQMGGNRMTAGKGNLL